MNGASCLITYVWYLMINAVGLTILIVLTLLVFRILADGYFKFVFYPRRKRAIRFLAKKLEQENQEAHPIELILQLKLPYEIGIAPNLQSGEEVRSAIETNGGLVLIEDDSDTEGFDKSKEVQLICVFPPEYEVEWRSPEQRFGTKIILLKDATEIMFTSLPPYTSKIVRVLDPKKKPFIIIRRTYPPSFFFKLIMILLV